MPDRAKERNEMGERMKGYTLFTVFIFFKLVLLCTASAGLAKDRSGMKVKKIVPEFYEQYL